MSSDEDLFLLYLNGINKERIIRDRSQPFEVYGDDHFRERFRLTKVRL